MSSILTAKRKAKSYISALEICARRGDGRDFQQLVNQISWETQPPAVLKRAIDLALSLELSNLAVDLAQKGRAIFPFNEDIQNAAQVLQPPTIRQLDQSSSSMTASMDWVNAHAADFQQQWVAVRDGELLAAAPSFKELADQTKLDTDTLVTKVL